MKAVYSASDVAKYLTWCSVNTATNPDDVVYLTPLQLQKLLYYAQGWYLAQFGRPLFADDIEAWRQGPVVPAVYKEFESLGAKPIEPPPAKPEELAAGDQDFIFELWNAYRAYSPRALSSMTHKERPWLEARKGIDERLASTAKIDTGTMRQFFKEEEDSEDRYFAKNFAKFDQIIRALTTAAAGVPVVR